MSQFNYTKKPNWVGDGKDTYDANNIVPTPKGWVYQPTGEVLVALGNLQAINTDALVVPTFTAAVAYSGTSSMVTGDVITVTITASEDISVSGTPHIALTIGVNTRQLTLDSTTHNTAVFKYTIVAGDAATAGNVSVAGTVTGGYVSDVLPEGKEKPVASVTFSAPDTSTTTVN